MIVLINASAFHNYHKIDNQYKQSKYFNHKNIRCWLSSNNKLTNLFFDRTGILPSPFKTSYPFPLPLNEPYKPKTFEQIVSERTKELINTGKHIHLYWSGGIDSTCILASFFRENVDKKQYTVHFTHTSVVESGTIFEEYVRNNCQWQFDKLSTSRPTTTEGIHLSGLMGNHIMGQGSTNHNFPFDTWEHPYTNYINVHPRMGEEFIEWSKPVMDVYPGKLQTFFDYQRFYLICFRWHYEQFVGHTRQFKSTIFYDTIPFQQWTFYSNEAPYGNGLMKLPMKKIIFDAFPDKYYHENKKTKPSQHLYGPTEWNFVLEDGSLI